MSWEAFVMLLQRDQIGVVVGVLLSVFIEFWPKYGEFEPKAKRLIFGALCLIVPTAGVILGIATGLQEPLWEATFWPALVAAAVAWGTGTAVHSTRKL